MRGIRTALLGAAALAALAVFAAPRWDAVREQLALVDPGWLGLAMGLHLAMLPLTAIQWNALLPPPARVDAGVMLRACSVKSLLSNAVPVTGLGHATAVWMLSRTHGVPWAAAVAAVVVLDTALQALAKLGLVAIASLQTPLPEASPWLAGVAIAALPALALARTRRSSASRSRLGRWLARGLDPLVAALEDGPRLRVLAGAFAIVASKLCLQWGALLAVQAALGLTPSPGAALVVVAAVSLATSFPLTPANVGTYQAAALAGYALAGAFSDHALSLALLHHAALLVPAVAAGGLALLVGAPGSARDGARFQEAR